jgi:hypothetical protein
MVGICGVLGRGRLSKMAFFESGERTCCIAPALAFWNAKSPRPSSVA